MKTRKLSAMTVIMLIIALPMYSALVYADSLTVDAYGDDNIAHYYRGRGDNWNFVIGASITGDGSINASQLEIVGNEGSARLDQLGAQCAAGTGGLTGTQCTFSVEYKPSINIPLSNEFNVKLYDDSGNMKLSKVLNLYGDIYSPLITFDSDPLQSNQNVFFEFAVNERAYTQTPNGRCVGISEIQVKSGDTVLRTITPDNPMDCSYNGSITLPATSFNQSIVTVSAIDRFGQSASATSNPFIIDTGSPEIRSLDITRFSRPLPYLNGKPIDVDITVKITETNLEPSKVRADFTALGGESDVPADYCSKFGDDYSCIWEDEEITIDSPGAKNIGVIAEDKFGNKDQRTFSQDFLLDITNPVVVSLETDLKDETTSYMGSEPVNLTMRIIEGESGISKENIGIDLQDLFSLYGTEQNPTNCSKISSTEWECVWPGIFSEKSGIVAIDLTKGMDDAGNPADGESEFSIKIDKTQAELLKIDVQSLSETQGLKGIILSGSNLIITAEVAEASSIIAYGDFSKIKNDANFSSTPGSCEKLPNSQTWKCTWRVDDITTGYLNTDFDLMFEDIAGNVLTVTKEIEIYGVADEAGDFWDLVIEDQMPDAIDRSTSEVIGHIMVYDMKFTSAQDANMTRSSLVGCTGDIDYLQSTGNDMFLNTGDDKTEPNMIFTFKRFQSEDLDSLDINCLFETTSVYDKTLYPPEYDNVTFHIPLFNSALGEASEATKEKVEDLKDTYIRGWWKYIGGLNTLFEYATAACRIFSAFRQLVDVWHKVETMWSGVQTAAQSTGNIPVATAASTKRALACEMTETAKESADEGWSSIFNKLCGFVNCKLGPMPAEEKERKSGVMSKLSMLGGRAQLCGPITDALGGDLIKDWTGKEAFGGFGDEEYGRYSNPSGYMNVKDSMVLSICSLCLPGIIYNLQKYRQIQCMYIDCLERSIDTGVPADSCDGMKDYSTCKYVLGEVFQFIPVTAFLQHYLDKVKRAVSDPFSIIGLGFGIGCRKFCYAPDEAALAGSGHRICIAAKIISDIGMIVDNVKGIFDTDTWTPAGDYCDILADEDEEKEEAENNEGSSGSSTSSSISSSGSTTTARNTRVDGVRQ